jgi:hypothetical protein
VRALYVLRKKEEEHEMSRAGDSDFQNGPFRESFDTERYPFADSSVTNGCEIGRLLSPLVEVGLKDSKRKREAPDM